MFVIIVINMIIIIIITTQKGHTARTMNGVMPCIVDLRWPQAQPTYVNDSNLYRAATGSVKKSFLVTNESATK